MYQEIKRRTAITQELFIFFWENKLWWGIPVIIICILLATFLFFSQSTPILPFVYTLF